MSFTWALHPAATQRVCAWLAFVRSSGTPHSSTKRLRRCAMERLVVTFWTNGGHCRGEASRCACPPGITRAVSSLAVAISTSIILVNPIPLCVVVCVDGQYTIADSISLSTLAVNWDLRNYLASWLELTAELTQAALGSTSSRSTSKSAGTSTPRMQTAWSTWLTPA
jgi:hypothetical protein